MKRERGRGGKKERGALVTGSGKEKSELFKALNK